MNSRIIKPERIIIVCIIAVLLCSLTSNHVCAVGTEEPKNILVINSYHQGFTWAKDETDGIVEILRKSGYNISIFIEYMDWKNYPTEDNLQYLLSYYKYKYQDMDIDIIIATDDRALEFVLKNRGVIFSNAPVVFSGVNQKGVAEITPRYTNLAGILEEVDPTDTVNMALSINPSIKDIYILFDNSESGVSSGKIVAEKIKSMDMGLNTIPLNNLSYDELIRNVGSYDENSIILVTTYYSDVNGKIIEFEYASREISRNSSVPVYHLYELGLNNGALGGVMISGKLQGENAAKLAVRILDGENPDSISIVSPKTTRKVIDYQQLKRFNISLDKIPEDCEIINKPFSFFEEYKMLVLGVLSAFIILITFVFILLFYIRKIGRMKKSLLESHEELTQIYEELAASEEELKQQFNEVLTVNQKLRTSEEKLAYLAYHDTLTGLPNKHSLYKNSSRVIFASETGKAALLFIDIDHFKYINDTMGHAFGDKLIIKVGKKLTSLLEDNCSIYRLGGDEFIIIIHSIKDEEDVREFALHIINGFKEKICLMDSALHISLSIGIAIYPEHSDNIEELIKYADIAMFKAKETGRKSFVVYDEQMNDAFTERMSIEKHMHAALEKNQFEIYYQPQLDLQTNKISGFEALLRWKSPELGFVSPAKFIKVAEDTLLIIPLGTWVLKSACAFLKRLHEKGFTDMSISVNISVLQLLQTGFCDLVDETLRLFKLEPQYLVLEITESILVESFETIGPKLMELRERGVEIALDDFGKGYSSLSYLKELPISTLKVDKFFIDNISDGTGINALTGHIVKIGKSMGMCVVAEGVERQEQLDYLLRHNCDKIQGYLYCKPVPEGELIELLESQ